MTTSDGLVVAVLVAAIPATHYFIEWLKDLYSRWSDPELNRIQDKILKKLGKHQDKSKPRHQQ